MSEGKNKSKKTPDDGSLVITRIFDAPRELVWKAWTDPRHMAQWWGPLSNPVCEMDVRPGGAYHIVMRAPDGADYSMKGIFQEIVKPERLVMTMDCSDHPSTWHDLVKPNRRKEDTNPAGIMLLTALFEEIEGKTKLSIRVRFDSPEIRDALTKMGMNEGWAKSFDRLQLLLTKI